MVVVVVQEVQVGPGALVENWAGPPDILTFEIRKRFIRFLLSKEPGGWSDRPRHACWIYCYGS